MTTPYEGATMPYRTPNHPVYCGACHQYHRNAKDARECAADMRDNEDSRIAAAEWNRDHGYIDAPWAP